MADAPKLLGTDTLRQAYPKFNQAIDNANEALGTANTAKSTADTAKSTADTALGNSTLTQTQLDTVVLEGSVDPETAQARVNTFGGTETTINERFKRLEIFINVKMPPFNAKGDGVTDDTTAIQSAIDSLGTGGVVHLPRGQYRITNAIKLKNNIHLTGMNSSGADTSGSTILYYGDNTNAIELIDTSSRENVKILNLAVINKSATPLTGVLLQRFTTQCSIENVAIKGFKNNLAIENSWYLTISNLDISYATEEGIILRRTNGVNISNVRSRFNALSGIALTNDCDNVVISGGAYEGNTHGIKIMYGKNISINTYFEGNKVYDIYSTQQSGSIGKAVNIYNCFFNPMTTANNTTQNYAIYLENTDVASVKGCYFADRITAAIRVGAASKDVLIENNFYEVPTKVITNAGTNTRLNEPQLFMDIYLGRLLSDLNANAKSITNLLSIGGRSDRALDITPNGQDLRLNYANSKNTGVYYGTGRVAYFDSSDLRFEQNGKGVIVKDKTTGSLYRIVVNNGTLAVEATT